MARRSWPALGILAAATVTTLLTFATREESVAAVSSDVRKTKHNLSASATPAGRTVTATSESQVCVFCHTPHGATTGMTPLWNRSAGAASYTPYTSSSLDAKAIQTALDQPGGSSKLCLSCHDGTVALGNVNVLNGVGSSTPGTVKIDLGSTDKMPAGSGIGTGFTRNLGTDLNNDHPVSVSYTNALALRDGELTVVSALGQRYPAASGTLIGVRSPGYRPTLPLEPTGTDGTGQVQCATCHDPHRYDDDTTKGPQKFLRQNRFQEQQPTGVAAPATDIICLSCHDKNKDNGSYVYSAHANPQVATHTYKAITATTVREFPVGLPVWKASCLNCHDAHTVQGARRLAREGTDGAPGTDTARAAGGSAIENTCYQCHRPSADAIVSGTTTVPDIHSDFQRLRRMPITSGEQKGASERHDIAGNFADTFIDCTGPTNGCGKDFIEPRTTLGAGNLDNRHAECTDCHNPHRVVKFQRYYGNNGNISGTPDAKATHEHAATTVHSNLASGVLRGAWGVEPGYTTRSFFALPSTYAVKRGDPGGSTDTSAAAAHVTREYQVCLKCHSDYGYTDDNVYPSGFTRPELGGSGTPGTATQRTSYTRYTNQAREFQPAAGHTGQASAGTDAGAHSNYNTNNHRSWHPVIGATGRSGTSRGNGSNISGNWLGPWNNGVGSQTMYCSDCHGSATGSGTVEPATGRAWGPHGSENNFILKGTWDLSSGSGSTNTICFKCHQSNIYAPTDGGGSRTGFWTTDKSKDGHYIHSGRDRMDRMRCNWCHTAVPHGFKNKALLVNLNDVGPEAGRAAGTVIPDTSLPFSEGPYYRGAVLKVKSFRASGQWRQTDCGHPGSDSGSWMKDVCKPRAP